MTRALPRSVREGAVYLVAGTLSRAVSLLLLPLYTRNLDDAEVGAFGVITALMLFLQIMTISGLNSATGRWYFHEPEPDTRRATFATWATNQLAASTIVFVVLVVLSQPVAAAFTGDAERFASTVRLAGLTLVTGTLPNILYNWYRLARRPVPAGLTAFGTATVTVAASAIALLVLHLGVDGAFGAQAISGAVMSVVAVAAMREAVSPASASWALWRRMLRFALPLVPGGAAFWVIGVADRFLLRALSTLVEAGRYHVVATVSSGLALATQAFQQTWGPMALEMKDRPNAHATYRAALIGYLALGGTLILGVAAVGDTVLRLVRPSYVDLLPDLTVLTASVVATGALGDRHGGGDHCRYESSHLRRGDRRGRGEHRRKSRADSQHGFIGRSLVHPPGDVAPERCRDVPKRGGVLDRLSESTELRSHRRRRGGGHRPAPRQPPDAWSGESVWNGASVHSLCRWPVRGEPPTPRCQEDYMSRHRKKRVCIGLIETAGVAAGLADGFAELGWKPSVVLTHRHPFAYEQPHRRFVRLSEWIRVLSSGLSPRLMPIGRIASIPLRLALFMACAATHDVFVLLSRSRFVSYGELAVLRSLRKQTVHLFTGSDVRPPYMDGNLMRPSYHRTAADCRVLLDESQRAVHKIERWSTLIVSHPTYSQLQSRRCAHVLAVGMPVRRTLGSGKRRDRVMTPNAIPVILHSPSSPEVKGTEVVRAAMAQLENDGVEFEYREIMGVENDVVLRAIDDADLVIDQCYSDTPLAMFATEAAVLGCPVIVGGYAWEEIRRTVPAEVIAPSILCTADELTDTVRAALADPDEMRRTGEALRHYVQRLEASAVAQRLIDLLDGSAPATWWFDPTEVSYELGCGLEADRARVLRCEVLG